MSEKEKEYTKFKDEVDKYFGGLRPEITDYVEELKAEKAELIEFIKNIIHKIGIDLSSYDIENILELEKFRGD